MDLLKINMKKRGKIKKTIKRKPDTKKQKKTLNKFLEFGNKKKVFWLITLAAAVMTIISIPIMKTNKFIQICLLLIWILETMYAGFMIKLINKKNT